MKNLKDRLFISGMDPKGDDIARQYHIGFEITKFSWVAMLHDKDAMDTVSKQMEGIERFWLHAPFADLYPTAIDPLVRDVCTKRFTETIELAQKLNIKSIVIHGGFVPSVYFPEWFIEQSIIFWNDFLKNVPNDFKLALENVMDPDPFMLIDIVKHVNDSRLGLCLDVGHANSYVSKLPVYEWIDPMEKNLFHSHIHNNNGDKDIHASLDNGSIDMKKIIDKLLRTDCTITSENMYARESTDWLVDVGYLDKLQ